MVRICQPSQQRTKDAPYERTNEPTPSRPSLTWHSSGGGGGASPKLTPTAGLIASLSSTLLTPQGCTSRTTQLRWTVPSYRRWLLGMLHHRDSSSSGIRSNWRKTTTKNAPKQRSCQWVHRFRGNFMALCARVGAAKGLQTLTHLRAIRPL